MEIEKNKTKRDVQFGLWSATVVGDAAKVWEKKPKTLCLAF